MNIIDSNNNINNNSLETIGISMKNHNIQDNTTMMEKDSSKIGKITIDLRETINSSRNNNVKIDLKRLEMITRISVIKMKDLSRPVMKTTNSITETKTMVSIEKSDNNTKEIQITKPTKPNHKVTRKTRMTKPCLTSTRIE